LFFLVHTMWPEPDDLSFMRLSWDIATKYA
jgi:hypothetical protein